MASESSTFYLQKHGDEYKIEMRIVEISIHPDYIKDGRDQNVMFKNGSDIAFAVVEIAMDKYQ